jgi:hypothetical protein
MKKIIQMSLIVSAFMMIGCGGGSTTSITSDTDTSTTENNTTTSTSDDTDSSEDDTTTSTSDDLDSSDDNTPTSELTQELKDSITFMYSEEGLAYDVYMNIYQFHIDNNIQTANQLQKIASGDQSGSEEDHIDAVNDLAIKYDLNITKYPDTDHPYSTDDLERYGSGEFPVEPIQVLYNTLYDKGTLSKRDALEVGCIVEIVDIDDLDAYIIQAENANASDVLEAFIFLRNGSISHYQAFDKGLKDMGIAEGCCSVNEALYNPHTGTNFDWCRPDYLN